MDVVIRESLEKTKEVSVALELVGVARVSDSTNRKSKVELDFSSKRTKN